MYMMHRYCSPNLLLATLTFPFAVVVVVFFNYLLSTSYCKLSEDQLYDHESVYLSYLERTYLQRVGIQP